MERYARHLLVQDFSAAHQQKIFDTSVLVVGAGGLGSALLLYLAAAGIGHLGIADFDQVSESNLNRQILYTSQCIGLNKVDQACKRISQTNPNCRITAINQRITRDNILDIAKNFDLIADATDNFETRYLLDDACARLKKPLIYGTAEQWTGQVSVFHYQHAGAYRDLFPTPPPLTNRPPGVIGPMPGLVGTRQALEILKIITQQGKTLAGKLLMINILNNQDQIIQLKPEPI